MTASYTSAIDSSEHLTFFYSPYLTSDASPLRLLHSSIKYFVDAVKKGDQKGEEVYFKEIKDPLEKDLSLLSQVNEEYKDAALICLIVLCPHSEALKKVLEKFSPFIEKMSYDDRVELLVRGLFLWIEKVPEIESVEKIQEVLNIFKTLGVDLNQKNKEGLTPFMVARQKNKFNVMKAFLNQENKMASLLNELHSTIKNLVQAVERRNEEEEKEYFDQIRLSLKHYPFLLGEVNKSSGQTGITFLIELCSSREILKRILQTLSSPSNDMSCKERAQFKHSFNVMDKRGDTPLTLWIKRQVADSETEEYISELQEILKCFINLGSDLHKKNNKDFTPFMVATRATKIPVMQALWNVAKDKIDLLLDKTEQGKGALSLLLSHWPGKRALRDISYEPFRPLEAFNFMISCLKDSECTEEKKLSIIEPALLAAYNKKLEDGIIQDLFFQIIPSSAGKEQLNVLPPESCITLVRAACGRNHLEVIEVFLRRAWPLEDDGVLKNNIISLAIQKKNLKVLNFFIVNKEIKSEAHEKKIFILAAKEGNYDLVKTFFKKESNDINKEESVNRHALAIVFKKFNRAFESNDYFLRKKNNNYYYIIRFLLESGVEIEDKVKLETIFIWAAYEGDKNFLDLLLKKDVSIIETKDIKGHTALQIAREYKNLELMRFLINKGIKFEKEEHKNEIFILGAQERNVDLIHALLKRGVRIEGENMNKAAGKAFESAMKHFSYETIELLFNNGFDVNYKYESGESLVNKATQEKNLRVIQSLLEKGALFDENQTKRILELAIKEEGSYLIQLLLKRDINFEGDEMKELANRAFNLAVHMHKNEIIELFFKKNIGLYYRNDQEIFGNYRTPVGDIREILEERMNRKSNESDKEEDRQLIYLLEEKRKTV